MMRLLALLVLLAPVRLLAASPLVWGSMAGGGSGTISGVVLSTGGAPLDRATVTLSDAGAQDSQLAEMVTGPSGYFRFDNLPAGKYRLDGSRRGYITSSYEEHVGGYFTAIVVGPGLDSQGLRFRLSPEGVIAGVVSDDSGEAVGGAQVMLYRVDRNTGMDKVVQDGMDATDDTGAYEFARLRPGTYYVAVSANPWYAVHPQPRSQDQGSDAAAEQAPSPLDVAYPMTFYPNATDSDAASPINLNPGDHEQINFSLHAVPAVHIEVRVPSPGTPSHGFTIPQVSREIFGTDQYVPLGAVSMASQNGSMVADLGGLAPGNYVLRQFGPSGEQGHESVDVSGTQIFDSPTSATSGVDVTGKIGMAASDPIPERTRISLAPAEGGGMGEQANVAADGTFSFHSVAPGNYNVQISSSGAALAVLQMAASGAETDGSRLTVSTDPVLLAATVVRGTATLNGYVRTGDRGFGGALVLLVPADPKSSQDLIRLDQSDSDGSFTLYRVFPGNYTLVAIDNGWNLDWARRDVIAPYLAHGMKLQVTGQQKTLQLSDPVEVQGR